MAFMNDLCNVNNIDEIGTGTNKYNDIHFCKYKFEYLTWIFELIWIRRMWCIFSFFADYILGVLETTNSLKKRLLHYNF